MATCFAPLHVVVHRAGLPRHQSAAGESRKGGRQRRVFKSCQEIHPQPVILLLQEVFRLSDFSKEEFLAMMTKGVKGYSKAEALADI